ncbi:TonB-dependent heme/hemoglobin receptor family protein [uncultured Alphaproteobacteria bacterium]|uniref:TonB-dependent heme/hemoglobin receptor family protein n=1 Tax=uncultured Alphaproteobacteria bacterium TaxID=91750 RepID=A0A212IU47_9PROT|nr:TonB-dependent heme/hemoglobin receptor family protein [uncultured Alphaproteobacteria bacterium]
MFKDTWIVAAVAAGSLASAAAAQAQSAPAATIPLGTLNVTADPPADPAKNATRIDREEIESFGGIDDALRSTPGVFTQDNPQQPGFGVNIRGFEGVGRVNMMVDGVRQSFRFSGHEAGGFTYVDPNLLAGVDLTRGEVTTTGGGGLAGSVDFRTLDVDDILRGDATRGVLGRVSWGSNGAGFSEMLSAATKVDGFGVAGAISKRDSDDYEGGDGRTVDDTAQDLISGLIKFNAELTDEQHVALGAVFYNNDFFANSYGQTVQNNTYTARYNYNPHNGIVDLTVNGYYNDLKMKYTSGTGSYVGRNITDKGAGFDVSNLSSVEFGAVRLRSTNGFEYFHDDVTSRSGGVNPGDGTSATGGVFTENTFTYGIFDLTAGLRYSFYSLDGSGTLSSAFGDYDVDASKGELDPKITLAARVTDWLQPYVTFSRSMRAPTLQETMLGGDHPGAASQSFIPNPDLKPETQIGWEFGANVKTADLLTTGDKLTIRADYYVMDVDDYIASTLNPTWFRYQYVNVEGTTKVQGLELAAAYDMGRAFGDLAYTHSDSNLPSQLPGLGASQYLPDDVVAVTAGLRFLDRKLTVGGRYTYVSGGMVATVTGVFQTDASYDIVDAFATYAVTDDVDVSLKATNLFDEKYVPFLSNSTEYGPGRTVYLATQFRF